MPIIQETKTKKPAFSYSLDATKSANKLLKMGIHTAERENYLPTPLVRIVGAHDISEDLDKIETVNAVHEGAYALTLMYDEMGKQALARVRSAGDLTLPEEEPFTGQQLSHQIDNITAYSIAVGSLALNFTQGNPTKELVQDVRETGRAIIYAALKEDPQLVQKPVDSLLGIDTFLQSEVDSISLEVHDIRSPLTALKGNLQLAQRKGYQIEKELPDEIRDFIYQHWHKGELMRQHLAASVHLSLFTPAQLIKELQAVVAEGSLGNGWNIRFPEDTSQEPAVMFNRYRLKSIFENALGNSHKSRRLLEETYLRTAFTATSDEEAVRALRFLERLDPRTDAPHELEIAIEEVTLGRRLRSLDGERMRYLELVFRDNGIGNDHINTRRQWRRNFTTGNSNWSSSGMIDGTGIAMGKHREIVQKLFPGTHADMFLRSRSDDKQGAELVLRLPQAPPLY